MRIISFIKRVLINNTIRLLSIFIKKDYNLWLFSELGGNMFSGNLWYFYKYIKNNHKEIKTACFVNTEELRGKVSNQNNVAFPVNTIGSLMTVLKAGVCIFQDDMANDMVNYSRRDTLKINLWHGGGIKKIFYSKKQSKHLITNKPIKKIIIDKVKILLNYVRHEEYDFIAYKADIFKDIMIEAFNNKNVFLTGNARDDLFFKKIDRNYILEKYQLQEIKNKKIITYVPTFRDNTKNDINYNIFKNNTKILKMLNDQEVVILQKKHPRRLLKYPIQNKIKKDQNIYTLNKDIDTQELFYITDIIITDYSGCYFDFLHTLRPIIFFPYDLKEYLIHDRELYFDYNDDLITPGPKVLNENDLFLTIENFLMNPNLYLEERKKSLNHFQKYSDGYASKRVYDSIQAILEKRQPS